MAHLSIQQKQITVLTHEAASEGASVGSAELAVGWAHLRYARGDGEKKRKYAGNDAITKKAAKAEAAGCRATELITALC